jgi:hypothetical protein
MGNWTQLRAGTAPTLRDEQHESSGQTFFAMSVNVDFNPKIIGEPRVPASIVRAMRQHGRAAGIPGAPCAFEGVYARFPV